MGKYAMKVAYNERIEDFGGRVLNIVHQYLHGDPSPHTSDIMADIIKTAENLDLQRWKRGDDE